MKTLSNTETDFQKCVAYKKKPVVRPEGYRDPRNKVEFLNTAKRLVQFEPGSFRL